MHLTCLSTNPIQLDSGLDIIIFNTKKVFVNNNDIEEEKLCRLISTEIYTTFISNKKLPDPKKKKKIQTFIKLINTTKCHSV